MIAIPAILETVRLLAKQVGSEVAIRGNADQAAFSLACMVRGTQDLLMELATEPENPAIHQLLEVCYKGHLAGHRALVKAGAHLTSLGDSLAGPNVVAPSMFNQFARPYQKRLVKDLTREGIFTVIYICGDTTKILPRLAQYAFCGFELDYKTDMVMAKSTVGVPHVLFGNIDPSSVIACGCPEQVRKNTRQLLSVWKPRGYFVLNSGCVIPPSSPPENISALIETVHQGGAYATTDGV